MSTADRKTIRALEKFAALAERNRAEVLISLMSSVAGRAWVWFNLEQANVFSTVYNDNPYRTYFLEGKRSEGIRLLNDVIQSCPEEFILAMRESNERRTQRPASGSTDGDFGERPDSEESGRIDQGPGGGSGILGDEAAA